jgi:group I intron endonuclease
MFTDSQNDNLDYISILEEKPYGIIYRVINKINGKIYIGQTTKTLKYRAKRHLESAKRNDGNRFQKALNKHGIENFEFEEIDSGNSSKELNYLEKYWVKFYNTLSFEMGYNSVMPCEVDYIKVRTKNKGRIPPNKGLKMSKERRLEFEKNGEKSRYKNGHEVPIEWRKSWSKKFKGRHFSVKTEFLSVKIQCIETEKIYNSLNEAAREFQISHTNFSNYFSGRVKSVAGFQWKKL